MQFFKTSPTSLNINKEDPFITSTVFIDRFFVPVLILLIILAGNYGIFLGHTFFVSEDPISFFRFAEENMKSSGWRPDVGLGISFFHGDPSFHHPWSIFRWAYNLFPTPLIGFNTFVFFFLWSACFSIYIFLKKIIPESSRVINIALACLIAFGSVRYDFFHQSVWAFFPTAAVTLSLILYSFSNNPSKSHYFLYTLILTLSLVLGSSIVLLQSIFFSVGFFSILMFANRWHKSLSLLCLWLKRFFFLNIATGISIFILCGWFFYSFFLEAYMTGYVRDGTYGSSSILITPSPQFIFQRVMEYVQPGVFSLWSSVLGIQSTLVSTGTNCFSPFFPIAFLIFMFYKTKTFWEFLIKSLLLTTIFYQELIKWSPALVSFIQNLLHMRPPAQFSSIIHIFSIIGFAMCLFRIYSGELVIKRKQDFLIRFLAFFLSLFYGSLFFVASFSIFIPKDFISILINLGNLFIPYISSESFRNLIPFLIEENVLLFNQTMGFSSLAYYALTSMIMFLFSTRYGFDLLKLKGGAVFAVILLINQLFLAWAVYPLNREPLIWDRQMAGDRQLGIKFSPTDRIMRVGAKFCAHDKSTYFKCVKDKMLKGRFGPRRWFVGYFDTPVLELSAPKSFTQNNVSEFLETLIKLENRTAFDTDMSLNRFLVREPPLYSSKVFDIAGVNYLWSQDPLPDTNRLELIYSNQQFFLYKYLDSWPYYYLANRIDTIKEFKDLYQAEKGVAYLWDNDLSSIPHQIKNSSSLKFINLKIFEFGRMVFDFATEQNEFLVVNDAWHTQWQAKVNGSDVTILKANGIFKGIPLPAGKGKVELFFDNSPYKVGIWISVIGWIFFLGSWWILFFKSKKPA